MTEPEKPARWLFAVFLAVSLTACSVEPRLTSQSIVSIDAWVKRNNPDFYIEPLVAPGTPMSALIVPFRVNQNIEYAGAWVSSDQVCLADLDARPVFPKFLFEQGAPAMSAAQAVALARKRGVDLAVTGAVTYIISGGKRGDSAVSISMEIFDAASGARLWSMAHGGRIETGQPRAYIFFAKQNRMPEDPIYAVTTVLAADMGGMVTNWNYGHKPPPPAAPNPPPPPPAAPAGS
jgi:hypothetical protein